MGGAELVASSKEAIDSGHQILKLPMGCFQGVAPGQKRKQLLHPLEIFCPGRLAFLINQNEAMFLSERRERVRDGRVP